MGAACLVGVGAGEPVRVAGCGCLGVSAHVDTRESARVSGRVCACACAAVGTSGPNGCSCGGPVREPEAFVSQEEFGYINVCELVVVRTPVGVVLVCLCYREQVAVCGGG